MEVFAREPDGPVFFVADKNIVATCINGVMTGSIIADLFIIRFILREICQHTDIFHEAKISFSALTKYFNMKTKSISILTSAILKFGSLHFYKAFCNLSLSDL